MIELTNEVYVERPLEEVWSLVGDPAQWHKWRDAMNAPAKKADDGPLTVGSAYHYQSAFMGRTVETQFKVVGYTPERQIAVTTDKPVPVKLVFRCRPAGGKTRVVQETEGQVGGFFGIAEPLLKPLMKREFQKNLDRLKVEVEAKPR